tara:strand:+ start:43 stop:273 length:231 start_codon:yes stop_codon:yes gene_type:complete
MNLQEFYDYLNAHDWGYHYSDDHRQWTKGRDNAHVIKRLVAVNKHDPRFDALYKQFCAWFLDSHGDVTKPERPEDI